MARTRLSPPEVDERRRLVCSAAAKLFARQGYPAVTMRAIAAETRRSHTAAYRYFRSKNEIFHFVRATAFRRFADSLDAASQRERDPGRRFRKLISAYVDFALSDPDAYRLMFDLTQGPKEETPEVAAEMARAFGHALATARAAVEAGAVEGDEVSLAHFLWSPFHGLVTLHLANQLIHGRSLEDLVQPMIDFLLAGKPPTAVRRRVRGKTGTRASRRRASSTARTEIPPRNRT